MQKALYGTIGKNANRTAEYIRNQLKQSEKAVSLLGGKIEKTVKFQLPDTEIGRSFVKIKKISETRKKYPRKAGLPAKEPLS